jgi:hypothetical protein
MNRIAAMSLVAAMVLAACSSAAAPTPLIVYVTPAPLPSAAAPTPLIVYITPAPLPSNDAQNVWCSHHRYDPIRAAVDLKMYDPNSDPQLTSERKDGTLVTEPLGKSLAMAAIWIAIGNLQTKDYEVLAGILDAWKKVDPPGFDRACAAAFGSR